MICCLNTSRPDRLCGPKSAKRMSNASLRKRLGIKDANYPLASRIIRDTIKVELVKSHGEGAGSRRDAIYVPFWA